MKKIMTLAKNKMRRIALLAGGFVVAAMSLGTGAVASANSYSWDQNNSGGYGNYSRYSSNYQRQDYNNNHRHYTQYRWVYDPFLHRWVQIGYNDRTDRWELIHNYDRFTSHNNNRWDNRNGNYWFND